MFRKSDSQELTTFKIDNPLARSNSNQQSGQSARAGVDYVEQGNSGFRRVISQEMRFDEPGDTTDWFNKHTKELENVDTPFEKVPKNPDSLFGKMFSKTFSDYQPFGKVSDYDSQ